MSHQPPRPAQSLRFCSNKISAGAGSFVCPLLYLQNLQHLLNEWIHVPRPSDVYHGTGLSGLHWFCGNGKGPHLEWRHSLELFLISCLTPSTLTDAFQLLGHIPASISGFTSLQVPILGTFLPCQSMSVLCSLEILLSASKCSNCAK